jgi:hypothetical protein
LHVSIDPFAERIAVIRKHFASKLVARLGEIDASLPHLTGEGSTVIEAVVTTYRRIHDVCGVGPTVGFAETGRAARSLDAILAGPYRSERGLTAGELAALREGLDALRAAAKLDMQSTNTETGVVQ